MIETLDSNKAVGEDLINHRVLKATKRSISKSVCILFNKSLQTSVYPTSWKSAIIMPLYKKELKELSNYRPFPCLAVLVNKWKD